MTDWQTMMDHPVMLTTGWALLHAAWVGVVLVLGLWGALRLMPDRPAARYHAAAATLLCIPAMVALVLVLHRPWTAMPDRSQIDHAEADVAVDDEFAAGFTPLGFDAAPGRGALSQASAEAAADQSALSGPVHAPTRARAGWLHQALPYAAGCYVIGLFMMTLRLTGGWWLTLRLRTSGLSQLPGPVAELAERARLASGVLRAVRFAVSSRAAVPCVVGVFRPIVLLPASAVTGLTPSQLSAVLAHELAHVRRHDVLINLLQVLIETLLFFHPAVWWVGRRLRHERECCCDDAAVASVGNRIAYVDALAAVAQLLPARPSLSLAATDGGLTPRIRRLVAPAEASSGRSSVWGAALMMVLVLGIVLTVAACGESSPSPQTQGENRSASTSTPEGSGDSSRLEEPMPPLQNRVLRIDYQKLKAGDMRYNVVIHPGDMISVPAPSSGFVYIMGKVGRPGAYTIPGPRELTLYRLVASAGGISKEQADPLYADVIRQVSPDKQRVYRINLTEVAKGNESDLYLLANDVIEIGVTPTAEDRLSERAPDDISPEPKPIIDEQLPSNEHNGTPISPITKGDLAAPDKPLAIGPGDTLVVMFLEPDPGDSHERHEIPVGEDGDMLLPVLGPIRAAGLSAKELEHAIASKIRSTNRPYIGARVQVLESRSNSYSVFVQGGQGGTESRSYRISKPNFRLVEALKTAKGVPGRTQYIYVIRDAQSGIDMSEVIDLSPIRGRPSEPAQDDEAG